MFSLEPRGNDSERWLLIPITCNKDTCPETISAPLCTWTFVWLSRFYTKPLCQPDGTQCWNALHLEMSVQSERRFSHLQHYRHICIRAWYITLLPSERRENVCKLSVYNYISYSGSCYSFISIIYTRKLFMTSSSLRVIRLFRLQGLNQKYLFLRFHVFDLVSWV
jgi:hypothetical protein